MKSERKPPRKEPPARRKPPVKLPTRQPRKPPIKEPPVDPEDPASPPEPSTPIGDPPRAQGPVSKKLASSALS